MKNIAIITPALLTGGAETMAVRLATNIDKNRFNVTVFCLSAKLGTPLENVLEAAGINTVYLDKSEGFSVQTVLRLWKELSKFKPKIVHSHISGTVYASPWVLFHSSKLIHTVHTKPDEEFSSKFRTVLRLLVRIRKAIIVAVSKENQNIAMEYYKYGSDRIKYVNNPVEVTKYYKNEMRKDYITFINVSRQDVNKNQILAIRAFKKINNENPNTRLVLVGSGNQHSKLQKEVELLDIQKYVEFPGEITNVEDYLANADVYISTSHREGLPLSMIEAMAAKLPIISSKVGGVPDLIDGNGILFEDDNEDALVEAMRVVSDDEELRKGYSERSFEIVQEYDVSNCAKKYGALYDEFSK